jgi:hypothetical protein
MSVFVSKHGNIFDYISSILSNRDIYLNWLNYNIKLNFDAYLGGLPLYIMPTSPIQLLASTFNKNASGAMSYDNHIYDFRHPYVAKIYML